jgi:thiamine kinase-like enzyme
MPLIVRSPQKLNRAWAQAVIAQHDAQAQVKQVNLAQLDVGTTTRVWLDVTHTASALPQRWFIKLPSLAWQARLITALPRLLETEIRFYRELAQHTPLQSARCLSAQHRFAHGSTLVLADVAEHSARAGQANDALTLTQAKTVLAQLAAHHAHFWQKTSTYPWLTDSVRQLEDSLGSALAVPLMRRALRLAGALVPQTLQQSALRYAQHRRKIQHFLHSAPHTLVHHDCHAGNLFWQNAHTVGFLDWQLVRAGEGISDVAYFLATALEPTLRQQHEIALIHYYAKCLQERGIILNTQELVLRYRVHLTYALEAMLVTLAVGGMMDLNSNRELIYRTASAVQDNSAYDVLYTAMR